MVDRVNHKECAFKLEEKLLSLMSSFLRAANVSIYSGSSTNSLFERESSLNLEYGNDTTNWVWRWATIWHWVRGSWKPNLGSSGGWKCYQARDWSTVCCLHWYGACAAQGSSPTTRSWVRSPRHPGPRGWWSTSSPRGHIQWYADLPAYIYTQYIYVRGWHGISHVACHSSWGRVVGNRSTSSALSPNHRESGATSPRRGSSYGGSSSYACGGEGASLRWWTAPAWGRPTVL